MTNLTVRPDAGPSRCSPPAPRITTAKTPALPAAASSASTRSSRNGAISGYGRAGGTIAGRSDRDHRDPRPRDREGSPRPGRPQAGRSRQRDRDIQDRRLPRGHCADDGDAHQHRGPRGILASGREPPVPRQRPGQDKNERHQEQAHAGLLLGPAAHPGSTGTIILRSSALRVLHDRLRSVTSRDEPGLIGPASRRTRIPARARHHQSR